MSHNKERCADELEATSQEQEAEIARLKDEIEKLKSGQHNVGSCGCIGCRIARVNTAADAIARADAAEAEVTRLKADLAALGKDYGSLLSAHDALEVDNARLKIERDKWLCNFNRSEQFQSGPTKRADAAEASLARVTEERDKAIQIMRTTGAGAIPLNIARIILQRDEAEASLVRLTGELCQTKDRLTDRVVELEASLASAREEIATWKARAEDSLLTWDAENEARHDAEDRAQELEAELIRLRSISSPGGAAETPQAQQKKAVECDYSCTKPTNEVLRNFASAVLNGYHDGNVGDIDGGWLQDYAVSLGLLVPVGPDSDMYVLSPSLVPDSPSDDAVRPPLAPAPDAPSRDTPLDVAIAEAEHFLLADPRGRRGQTREQGLERHLRRLLALLKSPAAETQGWQAIETAPKMRTILLFAITDVAEDGTIRNWKMETGSWMEGYDDERSHARGYTSWEWGGRMLKTYDHQPTHWRPLPDPPSVASLQRAEESQKP